MKSSYSDLKKSLRCANEEAREYLKSLNDARKEIAILKDAQGQANAWRRYSHVLMRALEMVLDEVEKRKQ